LGATIFDHIKDHGSIWGFLEKEGQDETKEVGGFLKDFDRSRTSTPFLNHH
jgi:hypothetical protein